jgi:hypothetical protein
MAEADEALPYPDSKKQRQAAAGWALIIILLSHEIALCQFPTSSRDGRRQRSASSPAMRLSQTTWSAVRSRPSEATPEAVEPTGAA